ncbi:hypothetical protein M426DRAFT_103208 [Hypoxylon sp. CI-4A]|nr:hypothetical protein M426DRAFT_103208 [Hypoxylon sp. CI-4A]
MSQLTDFSFCPLLSPRVTASQEEFRRKSNKRHPRYIRFFSCLRPSPGSPPSGFSGTGPSGLHVLTWLRNHGSSTYRTSLFSRLVTLLQLASNVHRSGPAYCVV